MTQEVHKKISHDLSKSECGHGKENPSKPEGWETYEYPEDPGNNSSGQKGWKEGEMETGGEDSGNISPYGHETRIP
jgi:hypothetical protein